MNGRRAVALGVLGLAVAVYMFLARDIVRQGPGAAATAPTTSDVEPRERSQPSLSGVHLDTLDRSRTDAVLALGAVPEADSAKVWGEESSRRRVQIRFARPLGQRGQATCLVSQLGEMWVSTREGPTSDLSVVLSGGDATVVLWGFRSSAGHALPLLPIVIPPEDLLLDSVDVAVEYAERASLSIRDETGRVPQFAKADLFLAVDGLGDCLIPISYGVPFDGRGEVELAAGPRGSQHVLHAAGRDGGGRPFLYVDQEWSPASGTVLLSPQKRVEGTLVESPGAQPMGGTADQALVMQQADWCVLHPTGVASLRPSCSVAVDGQFFLGYFEGPSDVAITIMRGLDCVDAVITPGRPAMDILLSR